MASEAVRVQREEEEEGKNDVQNVDFKASTDHLPPKQVHSSREEVD